ncbi:cell division protein FtsK, partial [Streptomyces bauhiniae]
MKHPDDDELFNRLEAEMTADPAADAGADVVDLDKARSVREKSADPDAPARDAGSARRVWPGSSTEVTVSRATSIPLSLRLV